MTKALILKSVRAFLERSATVVRDLLILAELILIGRPSGHP